MRCHQPASTRAAWYRPLRAPLPLPSHCVHKLFLQQATRTPAALALETADGAQQYSYESLVWHCRQLAAELLCNYKEHEPRDDCKWLVAVLLDSSCERVFPIPFWDPFADILGVDRAFQCDVVHVREAIVAAQMQPPRYRLWTKN